MAIDVDMKELAEQFEIEVRLKNLNQWKIRIWLGRKLIQLAAWIIWADIKFADDEEAISYETR
jgi:hypothetical protein